MSEIKSPLTLEEFTEDAAHIIASVAATRASVVIDAGSGALVEVRYIAHEHTRNGAENGDVIRRKKTRADWEAFRSSFGSWSEHDADELVAWIEESRAINDRPYEEL